MWVYSKIFWEFTGNQNRRQCPEETIFFSGKRLYTAHVRLYKDPLVFSINLEISMADMLRQCMIWYQNLILTIWMELQKITFGGKCWSINIIDLFVFYAVLWSPFKQSWSCFGIRHCLKKHSVCLFTQITYRVQWLKWLQWLQRQLFRFRLRASMTTQTAI